MIVFLHRFMQYYKKNNSQRSLQLYLCKLNLSSMQYFCRLELYSCIIKQSLQFSTENIYQIICQDDKSEIWALQIDIESSNENKNSRIVGARPEISDLRQFFMIQQVETIKWYFKIVSCQTKLAWKKQLGNRQGVEICLCSAEDNFYKLFAIQKCEPKFRLKTAEGKAVAFFKDFLKQLTPDSKAINQSFYIHPVLISSFLKQTCILRNHHSNKTICLPQKTFDSGQGLIQHEPIQTFIHRWRWVPASTGYLITSIVNGQ